MSGLRATSCEGYVTKRGHFRKSWRVRYMVLNGDNMQIAYYASKDAYRSQKSAPKGCFYLQTAGKHEYWINQGVLGSPEEKPFGFKMAGHAPSQGYVELDVFVDSLLDLNQWLQVIQNGLEGYKRRTRETVITENTTSRSVLGFSFASSRSPASQQVKGYKFAQSSLIRNALRDAETAKSSGNAAIDELVLQGEKLNGVERVLDEMDNDLVYSGKLIKAIQHPMRNIFTKVKQKKKSVAKTFDSGSGKSDGRSNLADGSKCSVFSTPCPEILLAPMDDLEELALALRELEHQATMINLEAIRSNDQMTRIDTKIETNSTQMMMGNVEEAQFSHTHPLPEHATSSKENGWTYSKLEKIAQRRFTRHSEAYKAFHVSTKEINERLEQHVISLSDDLKCKLSSFSNEICREQFTLSNALELHPSEGEKMIFMWRRIEELTEKKAREIEHFSTQLECIEEQRAILIKAEIETLEKVMKSIAHLLRPDVERLLESETYELNVVICENMQAYADLAARLLTENTNALLHARIEWEYEHTTWKRKLQAKTVEAFYSGMISSLHAVSESINQSIKNCHQELLGTHNDKRLPVIHSLCTKYTNAHIGQAREAISQCRQIESMQIQHSVSEFNRIDGDCAANINANLEEFRLSLHQVAVLAPSADLRFCQIHMKELLADERDKEVLEISSGLRLQLHGICSSLDLTKLISSPNVTSLRSQIQLILAAFSLRSILQNGGRNDELDRFQSVMIKLRQAKVSNVIDIVGSIPPLIDSLIQTTGMSEVFYEEMRQIQQSLETLMENHARKRDEKLTIESSFSDHKRKIAQKLQNASAVLHHTAGSSLHTIRGIQYRVSMLVFASDVSRELKDHLKFVQDQLELQMKTNATVDTFIEANYAHLVNSDKAQRRNLIDSTIDAISQQSSRLHVTTYSLLIFYDRIITCMEDTTFLLQKVNNQARISMQTLEDNHKDVLRMLKGDLENKSAILRHSPNEVLLEQALNDAFNVLENMELEHERYHKCVKLASRKYREAVKQIFHMQFDKLLVIFDLQCLPSRKFEKNEEEIVEPLEQLPLDYITATVRDQAENNSHSSFKSRELIDPLVDPGVEGDKRPVIITFFEVQLFERYPLEDLVRSILANTSCINESCAAEVHPAHFVVDNKILFDLMISESALHILLRSDRENTLVIFRDMVEAALSEVDFFTKSKVSSSKYHVEDHLDGHPPRKALLRKYAHQIRPLELRKHLKCTKRCFKGVSNRLSLFQVKIFRSTDTISDFFEKFRGQQASLKCQLPFQTSLTALQGLNASYNTNVNNFKVESMKFLTEVRHTVAQEKNFLEASIRDFLSTCRRRLIKDLSKVDLIDNCDYHPQELADIEAQGALLIQALENESFVAVNDKIETLSSLQEKLLNKSDTFRSKFQQSYQSLAMKEGLGPKYGRPRRILQAKFRSEIHRMDEIAKKMKTLIESLKQIVEDGYHRDGVNLRLLEIICRIRTEMYHAGLHLAIIKYPKQLFPVTISLNVIEIVGSRSHKSKLVIYDDASMNSIMTEHETFAILVEGMIVKCKEDSLLLHHKGEDSQEKVHFMLKLNEFLSDIRSKAEMYTTASRMQYLQFVKTNIELLKAAQKMLFRYLLQVSQKELVEQASKQYDVLDQEAKKRELFRQSIKPVIHADHDERFKHLQHSKLYCEALDGIWDNLVQDVYFKSQIFQINFLSHFFAFGRLLDSTIVSTDDLVLSAKEVDTLDQKRKSLKQLRKLARFEGVQDPREIEYAPQELESLRKVGESPRYTRRAYPAIEEFNIFALCQENLGEYGANINLDAFSTIDAQLAAYLEREKHGGIRTFLLTPLHRALIKTRDEVYLEFVTIARNILLKYDKNYNTLKNAEMEWLQRMNFDAR